MNFIKEGMVETLARFFTVVTESVARQHSEDDYRAAVFVKWPDEKINKIFFGSHLQFEILKDTFALHFGRKWMKGLKIRVSWKKKLTIDRMFT